MCLGVEEQSLADDGHDRLALEWLGDQKSRLRALTGQNLFRIGCDEDDRDFVLRDDLPHRIEPTAAVGKFYVRQNEVRAYGV